MRLPGLKAPTNHVTTKGRGVPQPQSQAPEYGGTASDIAFQTEPARVTQTPQHKALPKHVSIIWVDCCQFCYDMLRDWKKTNCLPACLLACLPVCVPVCLSVCLSVCLLACLSACLPVCVRACLSACLPVCLRACLSACLPVCLLACLSVCLLACLSVCLSVCLSACPSACLTLQLSSLSHFLQVQQLCLCQPAYTSAHLSVGLSLSAYCLSVCLSAHLSVCLSECLVPRIQELWLSICLPLLPTPSPPQPPPVRRLCELHRSHCPSSAASACVSPVLAEPWTGCSVRR